MIAVWYSWPLWALAGVTWILLAITFAHETYASRHLYYRILCGLGLLISIGALYAVIEVA